MSEGKDIHTDWGQVLLRLGLLTVIMVCLALGFSVSGPGEVVVFFLFLGAVLLLVILFLFVVLEILERGQEHDKYCNEYQLEKEGW